jgi:hypothetical protein
MPGFKLLKKQGSICPSLSFVGGGGKQCGSAPLPPSGFYHILKAVLEGPINGFGLSPSAGINIELQERAAWRLGK